MKRASSGVALVGVLWATVLLTALALAAVTQWRADVRLLANELALARAHYAAEAGVRRGFYELAAPSGRVAWLADGSVHEFDFADARVRVTLADEGGRLDLNLAPLEVLEQLFANAGLDRPLRGALLSHIARRREAGLPFTHVEEIGRVPGVTGEVFAALSPALTVHSRQPGVIADAAERQVLLAIPGADARDVDLYLKLRERYRKAGIGAPAAPLEPRYLARNGNATFTVHAEARVQSGLAAHAAATVDLRRPGQSEPFRVLEWRHDGPELF
jgi:general secretion pathway protein K